MTPNPRALAERCIAENGDDYLLPPSAETHRRLLTERNALARYVLDREAECERLRAALGVARKYVEDDAPLHTCGICEDYDDGMGEEACVRCHQDATLNRLDALLPTPPRGAATGDDE